MPIKAAAQKGMNSDSSNAGTSANTSGIRIASSGG